MRCELRTHGTDVLLSRRWPRLLTQGVFFDEPSVLKITQNRLQGLDNTFAPLKSSHFFSQRYDEAEAVLPIPNFQFAEQRNPIEMRILQRHPREAFSRAYVKVRPIQCVEQELGWIP